MDGYLREIYMRETAVVWDIQVMVEWRAGDLRQQFVVAVAFPSEESGMTSILVVVPSARNDCELTQHSKRLALRPGLAPGNKLIGPLT